MILCWSVKGGSGTTVVAGALAHRMAMDGPAWFVDIAGDGPALLGVSLDPQAPGVLDWMGSAVATSDSFERLAVPVAPNLAVVPRGVGSGVMDWPHLSAVLAGRPCVVDAGLGPPPPELAAAARQSLLVIRPCFLALHRARQLHERPTGVVLITEPSRAVRVGQIEAAVGVPVVARVGVDPLVSRVVDLGQFASRPPRSMVRQLKGVA